jgi:biotin carboxylase
MKQLASSRGVPVPKFKKIANTIELLDFIQEVNYPIVVKPLAARGSSNTYVVRDETSLDLLLENGLISATDRVPDILAEEFINGDIYHLDGIIINGGLELTSISRYINNCLQFVNGSFLGSITLEDCNPLKHKLLAFAKSILMTHFPTPANTLFHIEVFVTKSEIFLCEAASRLGGGGINDEIKLAYGIDIKQEFIKSQCVEDYNRTVFSNSNMKCVAARLLIPPKESHILRKIPDKCDFPWVLCYTPTGVVGKKYSKMKLSNEEVAHFLIMAETEEQALTRIQQLYDWFNLNSSWER